MYLTQIVGLTTPSIYRIYLTLLHIFPPVPICATTLSISSAIYWYFPTPLASRHSWLTEIFQFIWSLWHWSLDGHRQVTMYILHPFLLSRKVCTASDLLLNHTLLCEGGGNLGLSSGQICHTGCRECGDIFPNPGWQLCLWRCSAWNESWSWFGSLLLLVIPRLGIQSSGLSWGKKHGMLLVGDSLGSQGKPFYYTYHVAIEDGWPGIFLPGLPHTLEFFSCCHWCDRCDRTSPVFRCIYAASECLLIIFQGCKTTRNVVKMISYVIFIYRGNFRLVFIPIDIILIFFI